MNSKYALVTLAHVLVPTRIGTHVHTCTCSKALSCLCIDSVFPTHNHKHRICPFTRHLSSGSLIKWINWQPSKHPGFSTKAPLPPTSPSRPPALCAQIFSSRLPAQFSCQMMQWSPRSDSDRAETDVCARPCTDYLCIKPAPCPVCFITSNCSSILCFVHHVTLYIMWLCTHVTLYITRYTVWQ